VQTELQGGRKFSFLKKRNKKLLILPAALLMRGVLKPREHWRKFFVLSRFWTPANGGAEGEREQVFCFFFSKKKALPSSQFCRA
jgi:hypothetical protein